MFDILRTRIYRCPIDVLWKAVATQKGLSAWLMPCDFQPEVDHTFQFRTDPAPGFDGIVHARVLEVDEPRCLRVSSRAGRMDTEVRFSLEALEDGRTKLTLEHRGFGISDTLARLFLGLGWRKMLRVRLPQWFEAELESADG